MESLSLSQLFQIKVKLIIFDLSDLTAGEFICQEEHKRQKNHNGKYMVDRHKNT